MFTIICILKFLSTLKQPYSDMMLITNSISKKDKKPNRNQNHLNVVLLNFTFIFRKQKLQTTAVSQLLLSLHLKLQLDFSRKMFSINLQNVLYKMKSNSPGILFLILWHRWFLHRRSSDTYLLAITHWAPRLDRKVVIAFPRPVPPPVMKATFPWKVLGGSMGFKRGWKNLDCGASILWYSVFVP